MILLQLPVECPHCKKIIKEVESVHFYCPNCGTGCLLNISVTKLTNRDIKPELVGKE